MQSHTLAGYTNKKSRANTDREDKIVAILKLDKKIDTLTKDNFIKMKKDGHDVEKIHTDSLSKSSANLIGIYTDKDLLLVHYKYPVYISTWMTTDKMEALMKQTALFFELTFDTLADKKLLYKISDEIYTNAYMDDRENSLNNSYKEWMEYCTFIDKIKPYIHTTYSEEFYSKNQGKVRDLIYEASKIFKGTFLDSISKFLQNYNLNQTKKAKIDALLKLNIPHIHDKKTADHFVNIYLSTNHP